MSEAFLVAQDLHKSFNEYKAVDGISFVRPSAPLTTGLSNHERPFDRPLSESGAGSGRTRLNLFSQQKGYS